MDYAFVTGDLGAIERRLFLENRFHHLDTYEVIACELSKPQQFNRDVARAALGAPYGARFFKSGLGKRPPPIHDFSFDQEICGITRQYLGEFKLGRFWEHHPLPTVVPSILAIIGYTSSLCMLPSDAPRLKTSRRTNP